MRILFLTRLFAPHIGGVEKHVAEVAERLTKQGHTITIITEQIDNFKAYEVINKVEIYRIPVKTSETKKKFLIWRWLFTHRYLFEQSDIIHCHDVFFWYLPFRFFYPLKHVFVTFHGYENYPLKKKTILMHKISEKLSNGNICIGDFIQKWYGTKATFVSYGATDAVTSHIRPQKYTATFIGRLDEQTGILEYDKAVTLIKEIFPDFTFTVIGEGKYKKYISSTKEIDKFTTMPLYFIQKSQFAFVSRYLSILESFACKRLVFALYDNPIKHDYLTMTPFAQWINIANTPQELASQVEFFLRHPQQEKKQIEKAYNWVKNQTWEHVVAIYLDLWKK